MKKMHRLLITTLGCLLALAVQAQEIELQLDTNIAYGVNPIADGSATVDNRFVFRIPAGRDQRRRLSE